MVEMTDSTPLHIVIVVAVMAIHLAVSFAGDVLAGPPSFRARWPQPEWTTVPMVSEHPASPLAVVKAKSPSQFSASGWGYVEQTSVGIAAARSYNQTEYRAGNAETPSIETHPQNVLPLPL